MDERDTPDLPPGTRINGAVVEERVKAGGYGTVYRARDERSGTLLAIKFVPLHRAKEWAERESTIAMHLQHDNLVQLVGFGYWPHIMPQFMWLKMLYVQGQELDEWAWRENPDARGATGKVLGVARGLAVVHDQKIVHRDVKEANILVRDEDGEPVLLDFGAARREGQATITQGRFPPGTPNYRSPEAWRFAVEKWNERQAHYRPGTADDLYALGVVLYRLLTRRFPFEVAWDDMESVKAVIHQVPLPPHIVNPRVPEPLSAVCMKLLEKKPATPAPATAVDVPLREMALQALRRAVMWMAVLVGAALVGWWLAQRWKPEPPPPPVASSTPSPTSRWLPGQEVAPSWPPPEAGRAAAPPPAKQTPAAFAVLVTRPEDDALKKQQAPSPQGDTKQKGTLSPVAKWCAGAGAAAHLACAGAPVRPGPAPEACPAGAVETMRETLGVYVGDEVGVEFPGGGRELQPVPVREGVTSVKTWERRGRLPVGTLLQGRLSFGDGRIYGRFTEARTPTGDTYKVCMQLVTGEHVAKRGGGYIKPGSGTEMDIGSTADNVLIFSGQYMAAVERFE